MRVTGKMTSKGQVTIPAKIRKRFGLRTGDPIAFVEEDGDLRLEPAKRETSVFEQWRGIGNPGLPSGREGIVRYFRELRGHDELD
jgi:AbrB family looped-hinge helix DNA binding protein